MCNTMEEHLLREESEVLPDLQERISYHEEIDIDGISYYFYFGESYGDSYIINTEDETQITFVTDLSDYQKQQLFEQIDDYLFPDTEDNLIEFHEDDI